MNSKEFLKSQGLSATVVERFWSKVIKTEGCWGWLRSKNKAGYGKLGRGSRGDGWIFAHKVSWILHYGPIPAGKCVLHKCDNPECTRPDHLFLGTQLDNIKDMNRKGRHKSNSEAISGEKCYRAKLTPEQVIEIRSRTETRKELAKQFGVGRHIIDCIKAGKTWKQERYWPASVQTQN